MAGPDDVSDQWAMLKVRYVSYSALSFIAWEWLITLSFEADIIWRKETPRCTRLLYCAPRYLGLISLICNAAAISHLQQTYFVKHETCRWWFGIQLLVSDIMLLWLEVLLVVRIFALYDRRQWIVLFFGVMLGLKTTAVIILSVFAIRRSTFGDACLIDRAPNAVVYISFSEVLIQTFILSSTLYKHIRICSEAGWRGIPLLSLVTRDGSFTFAVHSALYLLSLTDAINGAQRTPEARPSHISTTLTFQNIGFPILMAITSLSSCRLIMNMQMFTSEELEDDESDGEVQLELTVLSESCS